MHRFTIVLALILTSAPVGAAPFAGPDAFGYVGTTIPYNLRDISSTGAPVPQHLDPFRQGDFVHEGDDSAGTVEFGFDFTFYGNTYDRGEAHSNGVLSFDIRGDSEFLCCYCCEGLPISDTGEFNAIAGYWTDLDPTRTAGWIVSQTIGSPGMRQFILGFYLVEAYFFVPQPPTPNTFEIILHEGTNDIELQYRQILFDNAANDASVGVSGPASTGGFDLGFFDHMDPALATGDRLFSEQGFCFSPGGTNCGVAVPEPASWLLVALGAVAVAIRRRMG